MDERLRFINFSGLPPLLASSAPAWRAWHPAAGSEGRLASACICHSVLTAHRPCHLAPRAKGPQELSVHHLLAHVHLLKTLRILVSQILVARSAAACVAKPFCKVRMWNLSPAPCLKDKSGPAGSRSGATAWFCGSHRSPPSARSLPALTVARVTSGKTKQNMWRSP